MQTRSQSEISIRLIYPFKVAGIILVIFAVSFLEPSSAISGDINLWSTFRPLGGADSGLVKSEKLGNIAFNAIFNRRSDTSLRKFFNEYRQTYSDLNVSSLYTQEKIEWTLSEGNTRRLTYRGVPRSDEYYFTTEKTDSALKKTLSSTSSIILEKNTGGFLIRTKRVVNMGPVGEDEIEGMIGRALGFFDFERLQKSYRQNKYSSASLQSIYKQLLEKDIPHTRKFFGKFSDIKQVGELRNYRTDSPPLSKVDLKSSLKVEKLADMGYVHLAEFARQTLAQSYFHMEVFDSGSRKLYGHYRNGNNWHFEFLTRNGKLYPIRSDTSEVPRKGYNSSELRQVPKIVKISAGISMYGMGFGMDDFSFEIDHNDGIVTWSIKSLPKLDLPFGIRILLSSFIQPFLNNLKDGNSGRGTLYREYFVSSGKEILHREAMALPIQNSPFISFILKLNTLAWSPLDEDAFTDLNNLVKEGSLELAKDYRRIRSGQKLDKQSEKSKINSK